MHDDYSDLHDLPTLKERAIEKDTTPQLVLDRAPDIIRRLPTDAEMLEHLFALAVDLFMSLYQCRYTNNQLYNDLSMYTQFVSSIESMHSMSFFQLQQMLTSLKHT